MIRAAFYWSACIAVLLWLWACAGCSSLENDDSYWNKTIRDPLHWDSGVWYEQDKQK
jgi:hypothetical protein